MFRRSTVAAALLAASTTVFAFGGKSIELTKLGTFQTGIFDDGAAEIVAYDPGSEIVFVINAAAQTVDRLSISDPKNPIQDPVKPFLDVSADLALDGIGDSGGINSVAVSHGLVAIAVENADKQAAGYIAMYDTAGNYQGNFPAGALPDMVTFTPDGDYILAANEGEPNDDYTDDPEGTITIVDISEGLSSAIVNQLRFTDFDGTAPEGIRLPGGPNNATVAEDLEPEYVAVSPDGGTAWVTLQENNGIAEVDIAAAEITRLIPLGTKDHSRWGNGLDASNEDGPLDANDEPTGKIRIRRWPVQGLYMPDAIASFESLGRTFYVTANEGDAREYAYTIDEASCPSSENPPRPFYEYEDGECKYIDEARIKDVVLDPSAFPKANRLQKKKNLGRLKIAATEGLTPSGEYEELFSFGARSFSIWNRFGHLIFDSGDDFERITAWRLGKIGFNSTNDENGTFDDRSDDKGPEPEGVVVGKIGHRTYAFIGLERVSAIMVYDVTFPRFARFVGFASTRNFDPDLDVEQAVVNLEPIGDFGPEGLVFIAAKDSPNGKPLLVVGSEVSGTTTIFQID